MSTLAFSRRDRETGWQSYRRYLAGSTVGRVLLSETIVILLAMQLEANNLQLGYLAAAGYFTGIAMLLTPSFFGGLRRVLVCRLLLVLETLCVLSYFLAVWIDYRSTSVAVWVLLAGFTGLSVMRNFAQPLRQVLPQRLLLPESSKAVLPGLNRQTGAILIGGNLLAVMMLSFGAWSETRTLLTLALIGAAGNLAAVFSLHGLAGEERIFDAGGGAVRSLLEELRRRAILPSALLYCGAVAVLVLSYFLLPLFRYQSGMPLGWIMFFATVAAGTAVAAGKLTPWSMHKLNIRQLLAVTGVPLAAAGVTLALLPEWVPWTVWLAVGAVLVLAQQVLVLLTARLVRRLMPAGNPTGVLSMLNFAAAVIALLAGLSAGRCADSQLFHMLHLPNPYSAIFLMIAGLATVMAVYGFFFLREPLTVTSTDVDWLLLSTDHLTMFQLAELPGEEPSAGLPDQLVLTARSDITAVLSADEIRRRLKTAQLEVKNDLLCSLFFHPRQELIEELAAEAADGDSWCRESALFALGAYHDARGEQVLLHAYHNEPDAYLRSVAAKSLARIGYIGELPTELNRLIGEPQHDNVRTTVNLIVARLLTDREGDCLTELFPLAHRRTGDAFRQQVYILFSRRLGGRPGLEHFFDLENLQSGKGTAELLVETADQPEFVAAGDALRGWLSEPDYPSIMEWCKKQTGLLALSGHLAKLGTGLVRGLDVSPGKSDAVAALYFTWLMLHCHRLGQDRFTWKR